MQLKDVGIKQNTLDTLSSLLSKQMLETEKLDKEVRELRQELGAVLF